MKYVYTSSQQTQSQSLDLVTSPAIHFDFGKKILLTNAINISDVHVRVICIKTINKLSVGMACHTCNPRGIGLI